MLASCISVQADPSGSRTKCVNSQVGIYDLAGPSSVPARLLSDPLVHIANVSNATGNVFEIVEDPHPNTTALGGYWIRCAGTNPNLFPSCDSQCMVRLVEWAWFDYVACFFRNTFAMLTVSEIANSIGVARDVT
jgi:hypothetical protein